MGVEGLRGGDFLSKRTTRTQQFEKKKNTIGNIVQEIDAKIKATVFFYKKGK